MAAPAPAAPATAATDAPEAKRQRLATTAVKWTPPEVTHTWTIEDLTVASFTGAARDDTWEGSPFTAGGLRWRLEVKPNVEHFQTPKHPSFNVALRLIECTSTSINLLTEPKVRVLGITNHAACRSFQSGYGYHVSYYDEQLHGGHVCDLTATHATLARDADSILAEGKMVISVTLKSNNLSDLVVQPSAPELSTLIAKTLPAPGSELADGVDVVFKAAGERIQAHSYILALRSSTLRASLWGPLAAKGVALPRELDIPEGIDTATFKRVLVFMYTDVVDYDVEDLSTSEIHALLHAADYLDVPHVLNACIAALRKRLAPDTAVATLKLAHALTCTPLLNATLQYIAVNAPAVMSVPSWAELMLEPGLLQAVLSTLATGEPPSKISEPPAPQPSAAPLPPAGSSKAAPKGKRK